MSGDRQEVESDIVLPAGMELVVPPPASEPLETPTSSTGAGAGRSGGGGERANFLPFVRRGERSKAPTS